MTMFILNVLEQHATNTPDALAVAFEENEWTYKDLYENAQKIAGYLQQEGYQKGDIVAQFMLNSDLFMAVYYGVQLAGLTIMPVNTKLAPPEVEYIFSHSEAKVLFLDERIEQTVADSSHSFKEKINVAKIREILKADKNEIYPIALNPDDTAVVMYTSGTTGKPKGVQLSNRNVYETAEIWSESMKMTNQDRMYICTPLFHCAGSHVFAVPTMYQGGSIIIEEAFSPERTLKKLVDTKATIFFGVPAMYTILLNKPELETTNFEHLRLFVYGASPMPYELVKRLKDTFPKVKVQNCYGQTENTPAASSLTDKDALTKIGSVGKPLARTDIKLVDALGEEVPLGEVGEICVKGPQVMKGYLRNPEETSRTIQDGWLYSGDLGRFDDEGFLYIVDRKKDMIIRGGENIYPIEIEEVLYRIPQVLEAAVVGIPHEVYGEVPKAFVVVKGEQSLTAEEVVTYCGTQLANYKIPMEIEFLEELPRNASGKVLKHTLKPKASETAQG
ncbi:class I adenylate-forming enzyme family protein [Ureibacillus aquaedulcis]|uniref:Long-chain fatty acid--CoA ligase n=1 Tax=Ureibacillus aquaedulcis TaxID=3058421 RepID=A0ABT8GUI0_9BACL|nr:long-chain fatty acid--CoA ligase [Ureibacillus sp. BA0131]MDN4495065.1 long-chain fatty acid--CoA ligase [Ureibacillus sp. BA0131]